MRRLLAVLAVASAIVGPVAGCSSFSSPSPSSASTASASTASSRPPPASSPASSPSPPSEEAAAGTSSSSSKEADDPMPDPAVVLKEASATTKSLKSAHLALSVAGEIAKMPVKALEGDLTNEPSAAAKGKAKIAIMGAEVGIRFVMFGRRLYVALPEGVWRDYGPTSSVYDVTTILDPDAGLANMLANFIDPKVEARETIGDQQTLRVTGKVTAEAVNKMVPPLDAGKRMPCTVWIQERGDHQVVQIKLEPSKDDSLQMTLSNWNAPVKVEKPAEPPVGR